MQTTDREIPTAAAEVRAWVKGKQASVDGQGRADVAAVTRGSSIGHTSTITQPLPNRWPTYRNSVPCTVNFS